jgi:hypothetical protein
MPCAEAYDPAVLQEASDHTLDCDVLRQTGNARSEAADSADHQLDWHSRSGGPVERVDDFAVHERVEFGPDGRGTPGLGVPNFVLDEPNQRIPKLKRGNDQFV